MEYKCDCGGDLVDYSGENESSNFDVDTINNMFQCEVHDCQKKYTVEFRAIEGSECSECDGSFDLDNDSTCGEIHISCINMPVVCESCGETHSMEYHPINIERIEEDEQ